MYLIILPSGLLEWDNDGTHNFHKRCYKHVEMNVFPLKYKYCLYLWKKNYLMFSFILIKNWMLWIYKMIEMNQIFKIWMHFNFRECLCILSDKNIFRISKRGGAKFSLATSAHTQRGTKLNFPNFYYGEKKNLFAKGGPWLNMPLYIYYS